MLAGFVVLMTTGNAISTACAYEPGLESDSSLLARHLHELKVEYALEEFSDHSFNAHLSDHDLDSLLLADGIRISGGEVIYAPDSSFKIFVVQGESCIGHCNPFWESWFHFNDGSGMVINHAGFNHITHIDQMIDDKYLIFEQRSGHSGLHYYSVKSARLLSVRGHELNFIPIPQPPHVSGIPVDSTVAFVTHQSVYVHHPQTMEYTAASRRLDYRYAEELPDVDSAVVYTGHYRYEHGAFVHKAENTQMILIED